MILLKNPFVTTAYIAPKYFCDRERESQQLAREITGGNNVALISARRMGKTGLIQHCFQQKELKNHYYTFFVDIYATKSYREFVFSLSKVIVEGLKPYGRKSLEGFWNIVKSLQANLSFDVTGNPVLSLGLGDIQTPDITLDELFNYLESANKPCLVAIDEFQQIAGYAETNIEAILRTYIQRCKNARFIFAGSQRHTMGNLFLSPARPFYQSVSMMYLDCIPLPEYIQFSQKHFADYQKKITSDTIDCIYQQFDGITWYMQKMLNVLFDMTSQNQTCNQEMLAEAEKNIIESYQYTYSEILFRMPEKQKELLIAIAKEVEAKSVTSGMFIKKYKLHSASSVQAGLKGLLEKDFITQEQGVYKIYDRFFGKWLDKCY